MPSYEEWNGYQPDFTDDLDHFLMVHRESLRTLVGQEIVELWFPWHKRWQTRWVDGPVVLEFQDRRIELEGSRCMFSMAIDTLNLNASLPGELEWVHHLPEAPRESLTGIPLNRINILSYDDGHRVAGLEFNFQNGEILNVYDNGDETGIRLGKADPAILFSVAFS